jgi:WD40 repeat protein
MAEAMASLPLGPFVSFDGRGTRAMVPRFVLADTGGGRPSLGYEQAVVDMQTGREVSRLRQPGLSGAEVTEIGFRTNAHRLEVSSVIAAGLDPTGRRAVVVRTKSHAAFVRKDDVGRPVSGSWIDFWTLNPTPVVHSVELPSASVLPLLAFAPDGRRVVLGGGSSTAGGEIAMANYDVYDSESGRLLRLLRAGTVPVAQPVFDHKGRRIAAITGRNEVTIWDSITGVSLVALTGQSSTIAGLAFSPDGGRLGEIFVDGTVRMFDASSGRLLVTLQESSGPYSSREFVVAGKATPTDPPTLAFSDDGTKLVATAVSADPRGARVQIRIWDGSPRVR